jgi:hypothetical protein
MGLLVGKNTTDRLVFLSCCCLKMLVITVGYLGIDVREFLGNSGAGLVGTRCALGGDRANDTHLSNTT